MNRRSFLRSSLAAVVFALAPHFPCHGEPKIEGEEKEIESKSVLTFAIEVAENRDGPWHEVSDEIAASLWPYKRICSVLKYEDGEPAWILTNDTIQYPQG